MILDESSVTIKSGSFVKLGNVDLEYDGNESLISEIKIYVPTGRTLTADDVMFIEREVKIETDTSIVINYDLLIDVEKLPLFTGASHDHPIGGRVAISIKHPSQRFDMFFLVHRYRNATDNRIYDTFNLTRPHRRSFVYTVTNNRCPDVTFRNIISDISNDEAEQLYQVLFS